MFRKAFITTMFNLLNNLSGNLTKWSNTVEKLLIKEISNCLSDPALIISESWIKIN